MTELAELRSKSPEIGQEITQYFARKNRVKSFMQTSISGMAKRNKVLTDGTVLGVWKITGHIGSGGMGDVYKAVRNDGLYDQTVALKVIQHMENDSHRRFESERKRLATLEHPGISRIIDGGTTDDGHPFMVLEYHEGKTIDAYIKAEKLTRTAILQLFNELCASVTYAHSKLILHRDIKPNNILVDATGKSKLIDFGIASVIGETLEGPGGPITIAYAAPEQLMGGTAGVGNDIFALGVLLHVLLTGAPQSRNSDGSVKLNDSVVGDKDLSAIILKATAFKERDRYRSVTAFSDDIDAYLENRPVTARNGSGTYLLKKLIKRNALASSLAAAFVVALSGGMIGSLVMANKATQEAARANAELKRTEWLKKESDHNISIAWATKDAFQYAYQQDVDQDRIDQKLVKYLDEISDEDREKGPDAIAIKTLVVGSHFTTKYDYKAAREILEPWVTAGTGDEHILALGQTFLAYSYADAGEKKRAGELFRKAADYYEGTPAEERMDYFNTVIRSALMLETEEGANQARSAIRRGLETQEFLFPQMYLTAQLYKVEYQQRNWEAAFAAQVKVVEMIEEGALGVTSGADTARLTLARMYAFYKRDYESALYHLEKVQALSDTKKGESKVLGGIHELRAVFALERRDHEAAVDNISKSISIFEKYSGKTTHYAAAMAQRGIIETEMNDFEGASKILQTLNANLEDKAGSWTNLLQLYISTRQDGVEQGQKFYDSPEFDQEKIKGNLHQSYYLEALKADGLNL